MVYMAEMETQTCQNTMTWEIFLHGSNFLS